MIWSLLACNAPEPSVVDTGTMLPDLERPSSGAVWDAQDVEFEIQQILDQGFPAPWVGIELYFDALSNGDETCPGHADHIDDGSLRGCQADSGWWYSGVSSWEQDSFPGGEGVVVNFQAAVGDFLIIDPQGNELECGGHQSYGEITYNDHLIEIFSEHLGSYVWQGHSGIYQEIVSGVLRSRLRNDTGDLTIGLEGAIQYLAQPLYFEMTLLDACDWNAAVGYLEIRDPSGGWITWTPRSCEPCGPAVTVDGRELGEVCVDFSALVEVYADDLERLR